MTTLEQKCSGIETPSIFAPIARRESGFLFRSKLIFFGKIAVAGLALAFLVKSIQVTTLFHALASTNWTILILAIFLLMPNILVQVLKWHYLLKLANPSVSLATAFKSLLVGYPLGFITPGRLGEIGRAFYVKEISQMKTFRLFIIDKATTLLITILFGVTGLLIVLRQDLNFVLAVGAAITLSLTAALLFYALLISKASSLVGKFTKINDFKPINLITLLGFSFLFYATFLMQFVIIILSFENVPVFSISPAGAAMFFTKSLLPISFGDLGIREGASVFFLGKVGVGAAQAFNAGFLLFLINIVIPTLAGIPILLKTKAQFKQ